MRRSFVSRYELHLVNVNTVLLIRDDPHTIINESPKKVVLPQHWESIHCATFRQEIRALDAFRPSKEVVEFGTSPEVWRLPPLLYGNHDGQPTRKMRSGVQEVLTLP